MIPKNEARPRWWVKRFVNPFYHKHGKGSVIRRRTRVDAFPFNRFETGDYAIIEDFSTVNNGVGDVLIGNRSLVGIGNVIIGPVTIGNDVIIAQNVVISGLNHNYANTDTPIQQQGVNTLPVNIEDECWIGANAVITAGVTIGKHTVIAAGAVVTKNIPSFCVAAGNPAKMIKQYDPVSKEWVRV